MIKPAIPPRRRRGLALLVLIAFLPAAGAAAPAYGSGPGAGMPRRDGVRDASWHLATLRLTEAHSLSRGDGVVVAVIDSGVDASHPDLEGNVIAGADAFDGAGDGRIDNHGHGTAVASVIAGRGHGAGRGDGVLGIAPGAKILPINVVDPDSGAANPELVGRAIRRAVDLGADVICVAIAGGYHASQADAIALAMRRDILVVAAAGNRPDLVLMGSPASIDEAVAVGAVARDGRLTDQSLTGPQLDVTAPGSEIQAAAPGGGYRPLSGTSMSAGVVAGVAALILAAHPEADATEQLQRLLWTAADAGAPGPDDDYGFGIVDPPAALAGEPTDPRRRPTGDPTVPPAAAPGSGGTSGDPAAAAILILGVAAVAGVLVLLTVWITRRFRRT